MKVGVTALVLTACLSAQNAYLFDTGRALYRAERYAAALEKLTASEAASEPAPMRPLYRAMCLGHLEGWEQVKPLLEPFLKAYPDSEEAWYWLGATLFHQRQFAEARTALQRAVELAPKDADALRVLGMIELESNNRDAAYHAWLNAVDASPKDAKAYYLIGRLFYESNLFAESLGWLSKTLTIAPRDVAAMTYLGLSYEALGKTSEALRCYRAAVAESEAQGKSYPWAYSSLGKLLRKLGSEEEGDLILERGAALCPEAHLLSAWGQSLVTHRDNVRAEKAFREAIRLDPSLPEAHYQLARLLKATNRAGAAKPEFEAFRHAKEAADRQRGAATELRIERR